MKIRLKRTVFHLPEREIRLDIVDDVEALVGDLSDADQVPCWAEIWPAARALARYIWKNADMAGQTVLELGSGLGLPGVVCGMKGAKVTFSDYNAEAVNLSLNNARLNKVDAVGHLGDWRSFVLGKKFDWIIGSDVFYDPKLNPYVLNIFRKNLKTEGRILMSHQRRRHTYEFVEQVGRELGMTDTREDTVERDEESVYGQFSVSVHLLQRA